MSFFVMGYFGVGPSVKKYIDPANVFLVRAFKNDSSRNRAVKGIKPARRGFKVDS
jgi:hypothetical protein